MAATTTLQGSCSGIGFIDGIRESHLGIGFMDRIQESDSGMGLRDGTQESDSGIRLLWDICKMPCCLLQSVGICCMSPR